MMKSELLSLPNSSHPPNLSPRSFSDGALQTAFAQRVMLHSRERLRPFPCWKGLWVLGSLSVGICQKYSVELLGPKEYNTPRPRGLTPGAQTLHIEINFADEKPNTLVDTLTAIVIVWPEQCTQYYSICCAPLSCSGICQREGFVRFLCSPYCVSLFIYLITSPLISFDDQTVLWSPSSRLAPCRSCSKGGEVLGADLPRLPQNFPSVWVLLCW